MARTLAELPAGARIADYTSLGVIAKTFPATQVQEILARCGRASRRQRDLPAHMVVYYVIALALYVQASCREALRGLLEGVAWLQGPDRPARGREKSGISRARTRVGVEPLRGPHAPKLEKHGAADRPAG